MCQIFDFIINFNHFLHFIYFHFFPFPFNFNYLITYSLSIIFAFFFNHHFRKLSYYFYHYFWNSLKSLDFREKFERKKDLYIEWSQSQMSDVDCFNSSFCSSNSNLISCYYNKSSGFYSLASLSPFPIIHTLSGLTFARNIYLSHCFILVLDRKRFNSNSISLCLSNLNSNFFHLNWVRSCFLGLHWHFKLLWMKYQIFFFHPFQMFLIKISCFYEDQIGYVFFTIQKSIYSNLSSKHLLCGWRIINFFLS
jgi:hypothetical protein